MVNKIEINGWKYSVDDEDIVKTLDQGYQLYRTLRNYVPVIGKDYELIYVNSKTISKRFVVQALLPNSLQKKYVEKYISKTNRFELYFNCSKKLECNTGTSGEGCSYIIPILNREIAESLGYKESLSDGLYYHTLSNPNASHMSTIRAVKAFNFVGKYNVSDYNKEQIKEIEELRDNNKIKMDIGFVKFYRKYLKDYSYGVELEYCNGFVRFEHYAKNGFLGLRDGSVSSTGSELASLPIYNSKDLFHVHEMMEILNKRSKVDETCSTHIHVGGLRTDNTFIQNIYNIIQEIQNELYTCFPSYRNTPVNDKVYCGPLKKLTFKVEEKTYRTDLKNNVERIFSSLNGAQGFKKINSEIIMQELPNGTLKKKVIHNFYSKKANKSVFDGKHKWDIPSRYFNVNFFNFLFRSQKTLEFRLLEGTNYFNNFFNWLATCVAILKYAENLNPTRSIKGLTLNDIIKSYYDSKVSAKLISYWELRKQEFRAGRYENTVALNNIKIY